jgi:serine/threonine protein kinase
MVRASRTTGDQMALLDVERLLPGDPATLGRYRLLGRAHTRDADFLAKDPNGNLVVIKRLVYEYDRDPGVRTRLADHLTAVRDIDRRHLVPLLDFDPEAEQAYLVSEFVNAPSLAMFTRVAGPFPPPMLNPLAAHILGGLGAIHGTGRPHGNLTAGSVLLASRHPLVTDYGVAPALVHTGLLGGMLVRQNPYLPPEELDGAPPGLPGDIFAWGVIMAYAAAAAFPFGMGAPAELSERIRSGRCVLPDLPSPSDEAVRLALSPDPADRPTIQELLGSGQR